MESYTLHFDGSCAPKNPGGTAAYGFVLRKTGVEQPIRTGHGIIGTGPGMTNNLAEFRALREGLMAWRECRGEGRSLLNVYGDSKLVIEIMSKRWKPNPEKAYYPGFVGAELLVRALRNVGALIHFDWVGRADNQQCDDLSKVHLVSQ